MALLAEVGFQQKGTSTGVQVFSLANASLTPKLVILWGTNQSTAVFTSAANGALLLGAYDSLAGRCVSGACQDGISGSNAGRSIHTGPYVVADIGGAATVNEGNVGAFGAGTFAINWAKSGIGTNYRFGYLALGGDDIIATHVGSFQTLNALGAQSVSWAADANWPDGSVPDAIIWFSACFATAPTANFTGNVLAAGIIAANGSASVAGMARDLLASTQRRVKNTGIQLMRGDMTALGGHAVVTGLTPNGFNLNWDAAPPTQQHIGYIAIKGPQFSVRRVATPAAPTNPVNYNTLPFDAIAALFMSSCQLNSAADGVIQSARMTAFGGGAPSQQCCAFSSELSLSTTNVTSANDVTNVIGLAETNGPTAYTERATAFTTITNGFSLNWAAAAAARDLAFLAIGPALAAPPAGMVGQLAAMKAGR